MQSVIFSNRGGSRTAATSKMERFVIIVNGSSLKYFILDESIDMSSKKRNLSIDLSLRGSFVVKLVYLGISSNILIFYSSFFHPFI